MRVVLALSMLFVANLALAELARPAPTQADKIADLLARNRIELAFDAALAWQKAAPNDAKAAYWVGNTAGQMAMRSGMFKAMGLAKTSRQGLERAVALDASDLRAQYALMQFYLMAPGMMGGDADEAKAIAERIAEQSPVEGQRAKAQLRATEKDMEGWLRENQAALKLAPAHPDALGAVMGYYLGKAQFNEAKAALDAAKAAGPDHSVVRYQYVKWAAMSGQELEAALADIDALIAMPTYPERFSLAGAHYRRAQLLAKLGRKQQAIQAFEACLAVDPNIKGVDEELQALRKA